MLSNKPDFDEQSFLDLISSPGMKERFFARPIPSLESINHDIAEIKILFDNIEKSNEQLSKMSFDEENEADSDLRFLQDEVGHFAKK